MFIEITGGRVFDTDYFSSRDCERQIPWCVVETGIWHVLIPPPRGHAPSLVKARPVTARDEPDGWRWRLEMPGWHLPLLARCFRPSRPRLPEPGTRHHRTIVFYHAIMAPQPGSSFFGSVQPGVQTWGVSQLWLERRAKRQGAKEWD